MGAEMNDAKPAARVILDPCVEFISREVGGATFCVAKHPQTGKFFELGPEEHALMRLLSDGCDVAQMEVQLVELGVHWTPQDIAGFIAVLVKERLAFVVEGPATPPQSQPSATPPDSPTPPANTPPSKPTSPLGLKHALSLMSASISQRFVILHGDAITTRVEGWCGWCFGGYGVLLWCMLVVSGVAISVSCRSELMVELGRLFDPGMWFLLAVLWCICKVFHEFGHAVSAKRQGVRIGNMGVMFFMFAPLAYVDVTDAWRLQGRWARARIALGGIYVELAIASLAMWGYWTLSDGLLRHLCAQTFAVAGPASILVNANPLLRLDGYYVLSDLANIANLRTHGRRQLVQWIERILFGIPRTQSMLTGWRCAVATLHALASVLFQVVWMGGLVLGVATWAKGVGLVLAVFAVTLWVVLPLGRWLWKIWSITPSIGQRRRLVSYVLLFASLGQYIASAPSPLGRRVPVVVRYSGEQIARASSDAFVVAVHVVHGQQVEAGMVLVELDEPELREQRDSKADELETAELRAVQFRRQGDIASALLESQRAEGLKRQLDELNEQVKGLMIVASRSGVALCPKIDAMLGCFVRQGDEVLRVADPKSMELLISVAESDAAAFESTCEQHEKVSVRLRGGVWIHAQPEFLFPRAQTTLPHPALASTAGGPLAVEASPDQQGQMQLIQPRLECVTHLDPVACDEVYSGQIGSMSIGDTRPLLTRLVEHLTPVGN